MAHGNKYHNRRTEISGHIFASRKEASRYVELQQLEKAGKISELQLQPKFTLQESFEHHTWGKQRPLTYIADFYYKADDGHIIVEDVKGVRTDVYKLKRKLFFKQYPEIDFREV